MTKSTTGMKRMEEFSERAMSKSSIEPKPSQEESSQETKKEEAPPPSDKDKYRPDLTVICFLAQGHEFAPKTGEGSRGTVVSISGTPSHTASLPTQVSCEFFLCCHGDTGRRYELPVAVGKAYACAPRIQAEAEPICVEASCRLCKGYCTQARQ